MNIQKEFLRSLNRILFSLDFWLHFDMEIVSKLVSLGKSLIKSRFLHGKNVNGQNWPVKSCEFAYMLNALESCCSRYASFKLCWLFSIEYSIVGFDQMCEYEKKKPLIRVSVATNSSSSSISIVNHMMLWHSSCIPFLVLCATHSKWIFARLSSLIDSKCVSGSIKDHFKSKPLYTLRILVLKVSIEPSKSPISWMAKWYLAYFYPFLEITHKLRKHWCLRAIKRFILHMVCFKTIKFIPCLRTFAAFNTYFETKSYVLFHCISETHNSYSQVLVFL